MPNVLSLCTLVLLALRGFESHFNVLMTVFITYFLPLHS